MQATLDYMALSEDYSWYPDAKLRIGNLWQKQGRLDEASSYYDGAMSAAPVSASLMKCDVLWKQGKRQAACDLTQKVYERAKEKDKPYLLVRMGNMFYEMAHNEKRNQKARD